MPILKVTDKIIGFHLGPEGLFLVGLRVGTWYPHCILKVHIWLTTAH